MSSHDGHAPKSQVALGFAAVYILWGSTYLGIRFAVASLPPLFMAGSRYLVAGLVLYLLMRRLGAPKPTLQHWKSALLLGVLLLLGGNGLVSMAETTVPSGIAALIVAAVPFWMVLLNGLDQRHAPRPSVLLGLVLGIVGLGILVLPASGQGAGHVNSTGVLTLLAATVSWAVGSLYAHRAPLPSSTFLGIAMEMLMGGAALWIAAVLAGEGSALHLADVTLKSWLALGYLVIFGSLVGFSAYVWLLKVSTPARVSTYAFVNPVIAVFLGWALAGEAVTPRVVVAGGIIVAAVCLILYFGAATGKPAEQKS